MAFYTDYTNVIAYNMSDPITNTTVSNAIADLLVSYGGCTLVTHATEGVASSTTNYAEVSYHGLYIRLYQSSSTLGCMCLVIAETSNGTPIFLDNISFPYVQSVSCTVKVRFYNVLSGFCVWFYSGSVWRTLLHGVKLTRVSNNDAAYAIGSSYITNAAMYCNDGVKTGSTYYIAIITSSGYYDADASKQVLNRAALSLVSNSTAVRYFMDDVYCVASYLDVNIVQVGTRYFFIPTTTSIAFEINS